MTVRDCPSCEQGKHRICNEMVLDDETPLQRGKLYDLLMDREKWVECPCAQRDHDLGDVSVG